MQKNIWAACISGFLLCVGSLSIGTDPLWVTVVIFTLAVTAFAFGWISERALQQSPRAQIEHPADWV
jgi:hypothetical protein